MSHTQPSKCIGANALKSFNSATVVLGGNVDPNSKAVTRVITGPVIGKHSIYMGVNWDTGLSIQKALSAGTLAYQVAGKYIGTIFTTTISGTDSLKLQSPSKGRDRRSINYMETKFSRLIVTAGWNYATGAPLTTPTVVASDFNQDDAAHTVGVSYAIPGELAYMQGGKTPYRDDYKPRTD